MRHCLQESGAQLSISTSRDAVTEYEAVLAAAGADIARLRPPRPNAALFRLRSAQPSRRAVLHLQAAGDPVVPADLAGWFTERACHFYLVGLRLPARLGRLRRRGGAAERTFAELDAVTTYLRETDGIEHVIVSAQGQAAAAAALWCARRAVGTPQRGTGSSLPSPPRTAADALILYRPAWPPGRALWLDIACPVLVLGPAGGGPGRRLRRPAVPRQVAGHVTWLRLPDARSPGGMADLAGGAGRQAFFAELGRWLGAYMYGPPPDRLL
jgi:hypothetical protein